MLTAILPRNRILDRGPDTATGIALTFDDGPHPDYTPVLLDELQRFRIHATFFVIGKLAQRHPDLISRMVEEGHTIGCHTYTHSEPSETSSSRLLEDVCRSLALLEDLTTKRPTLFRPPKGQLTLAKTLGLWKLQQTIVLWNQDPRDYQAESAADMLKWIDAYQPARGDIVLMHDVHPHCIAAIEPLAKLAASHNLGPFVTVDQWLSTNQRVVRPVGEELILETTANGQIHISREAAQK